MRTSQKYATLAFALAFYGCLWVYLDTQEGLFGNLGLCKEHNSFHGETTSQENNLPNAAAKCVTKLIEYQPSIIENAWRAEIASLKSNDAAWEAGCSKIRRELADHKEIIHEIEMHLSAQGAVSSSSLSHHVYEDTCTRVRKRIPIEPLTSFLRHPLAICSPGDLILDKSYMLIPFAHEVGAKHSYKWLFDAGASTYDTGAGGASQSWFVNAYRSRGYEFDRIIGWEAAPTAPARQWSSVPADVKRKTSWYNIPATTEVGGADNPLTFIKELTKPEDYVVFKLDIDQPSVEVALVQQIMSDPELWTLIDDFYFEHHVTGSPMQSNGWGNLSMAKTPMGDIEDSYNIFTFFREKGIRAHSWV